MRLILSLASMLLVFASGFVSAEEYHELKVSELEFKGDTEGLKEGLKHEVYRYQRHTPLGLRCEADGHLGTIVADPNGFRSRVLGEDVVVFRVKNEEPIEGFVDLQYRDEHYNMRIKGFHFTFTPSEATLSSKERFQEIRAAEATWLSRDHLPGTAWFRHLAGEQAATRFGSNGGIADSFEIFSGGRAVSENLALDRDLILGTDKDGKTVSISEIEGVTVAAIDWSGRLPEGEVEVDRLSLLVPEDQHAVFVKGLPELLDLTQRVEQELLPSTQAYTVRNPFRKLASRYRSQVGLDGPDFAVKLLPTGNVTLTGGDPFYVQGTDVAVLIESKAADLLHKGLLKLISSRANKAGAKELKVEGEGYDYHAFENQDRSFSSHLWKMGDVVVIANSGAQFASLTAVAEGKATALGSTDEYRFFRNRYQMGGDESAFVFLSDATIRRWASPEVRIAASRRTRALTAMGELTSRALGGEELGDEFEPLLGDVSWEDGRIFSETFGTLGFLTPVAELGIESVTRPEQQGYERWRRGYESGWTQVFDPIAVQVSEKDGELSFDLSVMPLTAGSEYGELITWLGKARLGEKARWTSTESELHLAASIDVETDEFKKFGNQLVEMLPGLSVNSLAWMTGDVSLELEKSLFWDVSGEHDLDFFSNIPLVVRIGSNNRMKLGLFMTGLRAALEQSAPGAMTWEIRKKDDLSYAVVSSNEEEIGTDLSVYYATVPGAWILSLSEDRLLNAMRRERQKLSEEEMATLPGSDQLMLDSSPSFLLKLQNQYLRSSMSEGLQQESWKALPILNVWHKRNPGGDLEKLHLAAFGEDIWCPGGEGYRWNAEAKTMESVAFGYPAEAKFEPKKLPGIMDYENVRTGLTFQDQGLRAVLKLGAEPERIKTAAMERKEGGGELLAKAEDLVPLELGFVNSYVGTFRGERMEMTTSVRNVSEGENGKKFEELIVYKGQEAVESVVSYRFDDGLLLEKEASGDDEKNYGESYLSLPARLIAGEKTEEEYKAKASYGEEGKKVDYQIIGKKVIQPIGREDITVPAGEYKDCIRIEVTDESRTDDHFRREKYAAWYHPEVGIVKTRSLSDQSSGMELQKREKRED